MSTDGELCPAVVLNESHIEYLSTPDLDGLDNENLDFQLML